MIGPTGAVRVMVATRPVDFRKGAEGLAALVRESTQADPFSGAVYVFRAKRTDRVKLIYWDGTGVCRSPSGWVALMAAFLAYAKGLDRHSRGKLRHFSRTYDDEIERAALLIADLETPFLVRPKCAVQILKKFSGNHSGLILSSIVVRKLLADLIDARFTVTVNVEK